MEHHYKIVDKGPDREWCWHALGVVIHEASEGAGCSLI